MTNFNQMRQNMILGQFLPGLIKDNKILDTLKMYLERAFYQIILKIFLIVI